MERFLLAMVRSALAASGLLLVVMGGVIACESGHWVDHVSDDGSVVILENGSVWLVDGVDQIDTALWLPTDDIVACAGQLIDTNDRTRAQARRIR